MDILHIHLDQAGHKVRIQDRKDIQNQRKQRGKRQDRPDVAINVGLMLDLRADDRLVEVKRRDHQQDRDPRGIVAEAA